MKTAARLRERRAALRSRLVTAQIDSIGVVLRGNFITEDDAIAWLDECGALQFVSAPHDTAELTE